MQNDDLLGCILARVRIIMLVASEEERYCERICSYYQTGLEGFSDDVVIWNGRKFVHAVRNGNIAPGGRNENIMFTDYASQFFGNPGSGRFVLSMLSGSGGNEYKLKDADSRVVFVLNDFNVYMNDPVTKRMLKNFASDEQEKPYSIIITTALDGVSGELEDSVAFCGGPLPGLDELRSYLEEHIGEAKNLPGIIVQEKLLDRRRLASAAYGLSKNSAEMSFRAALISLGGVTIDSADNIILHKKQLFRDSDCVEYYPPASGECGFGGYGRLQDEIKRRSASFGEAGQNYGLTDPKKAILLIGPPGCGKSFFIKEMAGRVFSIPLLRLNMAAVFGSEIGSSEKKFINALKQVERIAHAILWIDEIEKIITCGDASCDGGASQRLYGSFLTWLQEQRGVDRKSVV